MPIIQCYAPTEQADAEVKNNFDNQLRDVLKNTKKGDIRILLGEFNAKIGNNNRNREVAMDTHGIGNMNANREILAEFCMEYNLIIGCSIFPHKKIHKVTCMSPDGK